MTISQRFVMFQSLFPSKLNVSITSNVMLIEPLHHGNICSRMTRALRQGKIGRITLPTPQFAPIATDSTFNKLQLDVSTRHNTNQHLYSTPDQVLRGRPKHGHISRRRPPFPAITARQLRNASSSVLGFLPIARDTCQTLLGILHFAAHLRLYQSLPRRQCSRGGS